MNKKRVLFIVNPISGGKSKVKIESVIQQNLDLNKVDFEIIYTDFSSHAEEIVKEKKSDFDLIVAVGGDGTINEIARKLSLYDTPLGIVPMGSGNGLARYLNISLKPERAIKELNYQKTKKLDTATLNGHFFVSIAGVGFDSLIASEFDKAKGRGFLTYARLTIKHYFLYKERKYKLTLDGKEYERKAFMVSFANSNQFGYNTRISPKADISDSLLDVCIVRKPNLFQIPRLLFQLWIGNADKSGQIEIIKAHKIQVQQKDNLYANIDGESVKVGNRIEIEIKNQNLEVIVPSKE